MNGVNGSGPPGNGAMSRPRVPPVQEALKHSPLCSIVPFNPDIISIPLAAPTSSFQLFSSQDERRAARKTLDSLNTEAANCQKTSVRLQKTLKDIKRLLNQEGGVQYNFKPPTPLALSTSKPPASTPVKLSTFAKMALGNTSVPYKYGAYGTATSKPEPSTPHPPTAPKQSVPSKLQPAKLVAVQVNVTPSSQHIKVPTPQTPQTPQTLSQAPALQRVPSGPAVVILPIPKNRNEYQSFPDVDAQVRSANKKRKHDEDARDDYLELSVDQRAKADASVQDLVALLNDIFEAEDRYQPDTSGVVSHEANAFFLPSGASDSEVPVLAAAAQGRLDNAMLKVMQFNRLSAVLVELLIRAQKICEAVVGTIDAISLHVGDGWTDEDVQEWCVRLESAENGLQAGKTLLRIMNGGREEKQLYSEELLQSVLNSVKHVIDSCLIPAVEARSSGATADLYKVYSAQKKQMGYLVQVCGRVLRLLGDLIVKIDVAESAITAMEFLSTSLIFVENAHFEKDSALGIRKFESMRRIAMDALSRIFARYTDQRIFIFDEILTSLEKLPVTRQSARQFKMEDGKPIQLVSALLMQLIQMSASRSVKDSHRSIKNGIQNGANETDEDDDDESMDNGSSGDNNYGATLPPDLRGVAEPLYEAAFKNTRYVVHFMVSRALTATKSGDQPYRNLLDIFTEDFLAVLGHADWPAAEMFLQVLLRQMIALLNEKNPVPSKNMALDLMGLMGSGISDLRTHVTQMARTLDRSDSQSSTQLTERAVEILDGKLEIGDILGFEDFFRTVIEFLQAEGQGEGRLQGASGLHLAVWAKQIYDPIKRDVDEDDSSATSSRLQPRIRSMILDPLWLRDQFGSDFEAVSKPQGHLAAASIALSMPFCKAFSSILNYLLTSLSSEHASLKSRALKSVVQLLEKDPAILERSNLVLQHVIRCSSDASSLVRDSALGLVGKCLLIKPALESSLYEKIINRTFDQASTVRKRAIRLLKDIHLRNETNEIRAAISSALLHRVQDPEESVAELSRQIMEEIWFSPLHGSGSSKLDPLKLKLMLRQQVALIVQTVQRGDVVLPKLDALLRTVMSKNSKNSEANSEACKLMVSTLFDGVIDQEDLPGSPLQRYVLETLTVFAKANPRLFTVEQMELLQPYVQNLTTEDDLHVFQSTIIIFRHCFPTLTSYRDEFLRNVQHSMLTTCSKLPKAQVDEITQCLWIIDGVLKNTERLVRLTTSVVVGMLGSKDKELDAKALLRLKKYIMIGGYLGKACNLDSHASAFREKLPWWKGTSVAALIVDQICPFTKQKYPMDLREQAFESIGVVAQTWAKQFERPDVRTAFELSFHNREQRLENIVLTAFQKFLDLEEKRSESGAEIAVGEGAVHGRERLGISLVANENDGVSTSIAQRYMQHIIRIAMGPPDDFALLAAEIIASINRQGLQHPKECGPALIALETSSNAKISEIAFREHQNLHQKHETMFEKEYMRAVTQAFDYQRTILKSPSGATAQPYTAKLRMLFEVLRAGNGKVRKRFLTNMCARTNFELPKLELWSRAADIPPQVLSIRFALHNLALFDYPRVEEILHVITYMEKMVSSTGTPLAHVIETNILKVVIEPETNGSNGVDPMNRPSAMDGEQISVGPVVEHHAPSAMVVDLSNKQLRRSAIGAMILMMVWETRTFLRRMWCLQKTKDGKAKPAPKDLNRAPQRAPAFTADKYMDRIEEVMRALDSPEAMVNQCKAFVELLSVDNELRVASEDDVDVDMAGGYETPSDDEGQGPDGMSRKRRLSVPSIGGTTPKKRKGRPSKNNRALPGKDRGTSTPSGGDEDGDWD